MQEKHFREESGRIESYALNSRQRTPDCLLIDQMDLPAGTAYGDWLRQQREVARSTTNLTWSGGFKPAYALVLPLQAG